MATHVKQVFCGKNSLPRSDVTCSHNQPQPYTIVQDYYVFEEGERVTQSQIQGIYDVLVLKLGYMETDGRMARQTLAARCKRGEHASWRGWLWHSHTDANPPFGIGKDVYIKTKGHYVLRVVEK